MIRRFVLAAAIAAFSAGLAGGDTLDWQEAAEPSKSEKLRSLLVAEANNHMAVARERARREEQYSQAATGLPPRNWSGEVTASARAALTAYEKALTMPSTGNGLDDAELHYRCMITASRYLDDPDGYRAVVEHGKGLREADPLDPREIEIAWDRSVALSKLGMRGGKDADSHFEEGLAEYERWRRLIDEASPKTARILGQGWSNAAELMMAVGRLEDSIQAYQQAIDLDSSEALGYYGLAVAMDRDGQWSNAKAAMSQAIIRDRQGLRLDHPEVFFVPDGDVHYYKGLSAQVRGDKKAAIAEYRLFLAEAVDSKYRARAREHLAELGAGNDEADD